MWQQRVPDPRGGLTEFDICGGVVQHLEEGVGGVLELELDAVERSLDALLAGRLRRVGLVSCCAPVQGNILPCGRCR